MKVSLERNGMMVSVWGPMLWSVLHMISLNYPTNPTEEDITHYYNFIFSLQFVLPCRACRDNMTLNLDRLNFSRVVFASRQSFFEWIYMFHSAVNDNTGKNTTQSMQAVADMYELFRARCGNTSGDEKGCTTPLNQYIPKTRCILSIVPQSIGDQPGGSLCIDKRCWEPESK